ncbi:unnamed protein product [Didymodactylos carnosus]|uniref:NAD(P)(+)--arginine ADP-ribosyltransferase n=1 Tax=Didymodactylos carnosus TaxID=1234261 RepID=A0A814FKN2_9BILA|nr:unnamed protein product [Didymodactylos carnosus]CAF1103461.1 unnamed protein product [Didymodactylos carnosus]CAF3754417.1 unnamed protein product [Didymodactylos carnosus]CAF3865040.1 unnamed protein product [Didymodactylos carnosus]
MASQTSSKAQQRFVWVWKSNVDPWSNVEPDEWKRYSDIANYMIESAYKQKQSQVELNDVWINFNFEVQINKQDSNRQRPIKRITQGEEYIRQERYTLEEPQLTPKSFSSTDSSWCKFLQAAGYFDTDISANALAEKAAAGIVEEGTKLGEKTDAEAMADALKKAKRKGIEEIRVCCARLYTMNSFLYKLINKVMRNAEVRYGRFVHESDKNYARTLGPYCYLLWRYLYAKNRETGIVVFRCAELTKEMIDDYKKHQGQRVSWDAFTSTTKKKQIAINFDKNTLFHIFINNERDSLGGPFYHPRWPVRAVDISSLSEYPYEEEVLLAAGTQMEINSIEYDRKINKYCIALTAYGRN